MSASDKRGSSTYCSDPSMKSRMKIAGIVVSLCILVFAGLCFFQYWRFARYGTIDSGSIPVADPDDYSWEVEEITRANGNYLINGWIARNGESIDTRLIELVIKKEDGTSYLVSTDMVERQDVSDRLNGTVPALDYSAAGFSAAVNGRYLSPGDRLFVLYQNNGRYELVELSDVF